MYWIHSTQEAFLFLGYNKDVSIFYINVIISYYYAFPIYIPTCYLMVLIPSIELNQAVYESYVIVIVFEGLIGCGTEIPSWQSYPNKHTKSGTELKVWKVDLAIMPTVHYWSISKLVIMNLFLTILT